MSHKSFLKSQSAALEAAIDATRDELADCKARRAASINSDEQCETVDRTDVLIRRLAGLQTWHNSVNSGLTLTHRDERIAAGTVHRNANVSC